MTTNLATTRTKRANDDARQDDRLPKRVQLTERVTYVLSLSHSEEQKLTLNIVA